MSATTLSDPLIQTQDVLSPQERVQRNQAEIKAWAIDYDRKTRAVDVSPHSLEFISQSWNGTAPQSKATHSVDTYWGLLDPNNQEHTNSVRNALLEEAKKADEQITTEQEAVAFYKRMVDQRTVKKEQEINSVDLSETYTPEQLDFLAKYVQSEKRIASRVDAVKAEANTYLVEKNITLPIDVNFIIDSIVGNLAPGRIDLDFGSKILSLVNIKNGEAASLAFKKIQEYFSSTLSPLETQVRGNPEINQKPLEVTGFGPEKELVVNALDVWVPHQLRTNLAAFVRSDEPLPEHSRELAKNVTPEMAKISRIAAQYNQKTGVAEIYTHRIGNIDPSEMWILIHEVGHSDLRSLLQYPHLLVDYLAIPPEGKHALTRYVESVQVESGIPLFTSNKATLGTKYVERLAEMTVLALTDPESLKNRSEKLYLWAREFFGRRLGPDYDSRENVARRWSYISLVNNGIEPNLAGRILTSPESLSEADLNGLKQIIEGRKLQALSGQINQEVCLEWARLARIWVKAESARLGGKPVSCELPLARTVYESGEIISATGDNNGPGDLRFAKRELQAYVSSQTCLVEKEIQMSDDSWVRVKRYPTGLAPEISIVQRDARIGTQKRELSDTRPKKAEELAISAGHPLTFDSKPEDRYILDTYLNNNALHM